MELNEQTLRDILREQREEYQQHAELQRQAYQRYIGTVAEDFKSQLKLVAEFQSGLAEDVRAIREQLTDMQERVTRLEGQVAALREIAAKNTRDIEAIRFDIEIMKSDLAIIRNDLKEKAGRDELARLESRVEELEKTLRSR